MQKAAAYIQALPYEAAQIQVDKKYITGNPKHNGLILDSLNFTPSVSLGQQTFKDAFTDLQKIGILSDALDAEEFYQKATVNLDGYRMDISIIRTRRNLQKQPKNKIWISGMTVASNRI